jgi:hypothetical protein
MLKKAAMIMLLLLLLQSGCVTLTATGSLGSRDPDVDMYGGPGP